MLVPICIFAAAIVAFVWIKVRKKRKEAAGFAR